MLALPAPRVQVSRTPALAPSPLPSPSVPAPAFVSDPGDEVSSFSNRFLATLRDGEGPSPVVPSPPCRARTSPSAALVRCRGRASFWWVGAGVVVSVVLALFAAVVWCNSVAALPELALPAELAMVGEWVEGGGLLVFGRRRVLFVRFVLCVAAALYFFV